MINKIALKQSFNQFKLALSFVWQSSKFWTITRLVLILVKAILPLVSLYIWKLLIDLISFGIKDKVEVSGDDILFLILLIGAVTLAGAIVEIVGQFAGETQQQLVSDYMFGVLQDKSLEIDLEHYEHPQFLDTFHKAQQEANFRPVQIYNSLMDFLQSSISLMAVGVLLLYLHWAVALVLLLTTLPSAFIRYKFVFKLYHWQHEQLETERRANYLHSLIIGPLFVKDIRIFKFGHYLKNKFQSIRTKLFQEKYHISKKNAQWHLFARFSEILAITGIYGFIATRAVRGVITLGDLVMYFQAFQQGQMHLSNLMRASVSLYENRLFLEYVTRFLEIESFEKEPSDPVSLPAKVEDGVSIENLYFKYPNTERTVLHDVSMRFSKGKMTAIVGENGAGKSTLVHILCQLYKADQGTVKVDGIDLNTVSPSEWKQKLSLASQEVPIYQFSIAECIRLGDIDSAFNEQKVKELADRFDLTTVVESLPNKYDQLLGRTFAGGIGFSFGQWRKISLIRTLYREADVYVLDEPTNVIDPLTEHKIFEVLKDVAKKEEKVVILVTHRLYNLQMADHIYVMDQGRVIEQGTHDELWEQQGKYARMVEKQFVHQFQKARQHALQSEG